MPTFFPPTNTIGPLGPIFRSTPDQNPGFFYISKGQSGVGPTGSNPDRSNLFAGKKVLKEKKIFKYFFTCKQIGPFGSTAVPMGPVVALL
jgi:hypothetical protein